MAVVGDPLGDSEEYVLATHSGIVIGRSKLPLAYEGDALFNVATFDRVADAEEVVEVFAANHDPNFTSGT